VKPSLRTFVLLSILFGMLLIACAAAAPRLGSPEAYQPEPGSWIWRQEGGSTTWYLADSGRYVWLSDGGVVWGPSPLATHRTIFAATATPTTWTWVPPTIDSSYGQMATGSGTAYELHCILTVLAAADASPPLYIMAFDTSSSSQPSGGTTPIAGGVSGALTTQGTDVTFSDQTYPALTYKNGLLLALSSTADTFTAPTAGNQIRCDAKLRSY
jgi:hypothetical protein